MQTVFVFVTNNCADCPCLEAAVIREAVVTLCAAQRNGLAVDATIYYHN